MRRTLRQAERNSVPDTLSLFSKKTWYLDLQRVFYHIRHKIVRVRHRTMDFKELFPKFHDRMWRDAARKLSIDITALPYGVHEIRQDDKVVRVQDHVVPLDHHLTLQLARNKPLVHALLADQGLPVPGSHTFRLRELQAAVEFMQLEGEPCVVKPALGSAGGEGVTTGVTTKRELQRAAVFASIHSPQILIERHLKGDVYRLLYLDGELIDAILRLPPHVTGDGRSTIKRLIADENRRRVEQSGKTALKVLTIDFDCRATLRGLGLSLNSVLAKNQRVAVKTATNESASADCESILGQVHEDVVRAGAQAANVLGVRLAGLDIITNDIRVPLTESGGAIIEVNSSPGLHYHYQVKNIEQRVAVAVPILQRLLALERTPSAKFGAVAEQPIPRGATS